MEDGFAIEMEEEIVVEADVARLLLIPEIDVYRETEPAVSRLL